MSYLTNPYSVVPGISYTGPGNVLPLTSFWGVRAYNGAYAAASGAAFDLRRASDNGTMTANFLATGALDTAAISSWAGGSNIFVSRAYDQTGNGRHVVQATNGNQPQLLLTGGPTGKPCIEVLNNASGVLDTSSTYAASSPSSMTAVANRVSGTQGVNPVNFSANRLAGALTATSWSVIGGAGGTLSATGIAANAWHDFQASLVTGGTSAIRVDGTRFTGTGVAVGTGATVSRFCLGGSTSTLRVSEGGYIVGTQWSAADESSMSANQRAYYGL